MIYRLNPLLMHCSLFFGLMEEKRKMKFTFCTQFVVTENESITPIPSMTISTYNKKYIYRFLCNWIQLL